MQRFRDLDGLLDALRGYLLVNSPHPVVFEVEPDADHGFLVRAVGTEARFWAPTRPADPQKWGREGLSYRLWIKRVARPAQDLFLDVAPWRMMERDGPSRAACTLLLNERIHLQGEQWVVAAREWTSAALGLCVLMPRMLGEVYEVPDLLLHATAYTMLLNDPV